MTLSTDSLSERLMSSGAQSKDTFWENSERVVGTGFVVQRNEWCDDWLQQ